MPPSVVERINGRRFRKQKNPRHAKKRGAQCRLALKQDADIVILLAGNAESVERELIVAKH